MEDNRIGFIDHRKSKDVVSPSRQRTLNFLHSLSRRLGRRYNNDLIYNSEEDLRETSSDSCSSTHQQEIKEFHRSSYDLSSDSSDISSNEDDSKQSVLKSPRNRLSISSFSRALQHLTPSSKSASCSSTPLKQSNSNKAKKPPQRILRQPVNYVYLKGMSGLPTRRVPRSAVCCQYNHC